MGYALTTDETLGDGLARLVREQLAQARVALSDPSLTDDAQTHEARKALKRVRAALRLVDKDLRPPALLDGVKDVGRLLGAKRDEDVVLATLARVTGGEDAFREASDAVQKLLGSQPPDQSLRAHALVRLDALIVDVRGLSFAVSATSVAKRVKSLRRRAREAYREARRSDEDAARHAMRKQWKAWGHAARLLRPVWQELGGPSTRRLETVGELLGEERDLHLVANVLARHTGAWRAPRTAAALDALIRAERGALIDKALKLGRATLARRPTAVARHLAALWPEPETLSAPPSADPGSSSPSSGAAGETAGDRPRAL